MHAMNLMPVLRREMPRQAAIIRRSLARVPGEHFEGRPHEKSTSLRRLYTHLAELPGGADVMRRHEGLSPAAMAPAPMNIDTKPVTCSDDFA